MKKQSYVSNMEQAVAKKTGKKPALGSGKRFAALQGSLAKKGATDPAALAAWIGRKKYGTKKFAALSAKGRKRGK